MKIVALPWRSPMTGRDPHEPHRVSTPLELFFDLTFVVAVSANAAGLHHDLAHGNMLGLLNYTMVFFAIWLAWASYTWFASAYDPKDATFRLMTFLIMAGVLVLAAGVPRAEAAQDYRVIVIGYLMMRLAMIPLWLRVAREDPAHRRGARFYALGIAVVQVLWILRLWLPAGAPAQLGFLLLALVELYLPLYAQRFGLKPWPWHPHHMVERYALFTIIGLGEVLLATTQGISAVLDSKGLSADLFMLIVGGFLIVLSAWWYYFKMELGDLLTPGTWDVFNLAHFLIFASVAALGAGLGTMVDMVQHEAHLSVTNANLTLGSIMAVYLLSLNFLYGWFGLPLVRVFTGVGVAVLLLLIGALGLAPGLTTLLYGLVMVAAVAHHQWVTPHGHA